MLTSLQASLRDRLNAFADKGTELKRRASELNVRNLSLLSNGDPDAPENAVRVAQISEEARQLAIEHNQLVDEGSELQKEFDALDSEAQDAVRSELTSSALEWLNNH